MPKLKQEDVAHYRSEWWSWWDMMQPPWRSRDDQGKWKCEEYGTDWRLLKFGGPKRWLGLVAMLFWWGVMVKEMEASYAKGWEMPVDDALWMLNGLYEVLIKE